MYAVIRRYEGVDKGRTDEIRRSVTDDFVPMIRELSGYHGYWLVEADDAIATIGLFETQRDAEDSTQMAREFISDHNLQDALPNPPQVTAGEVTVSGPVHALA